MAMNERYNIQNQVEHLQMKYVGTGHSEINKWEWGTNIQRDTLASHMGHYPRMLYFAAAQNESTFKIKYSYLMKIMQPCGPPPNQSNNDNHE